MRAAVGVEAVVGVEAAVCGYVSMDISPVPLLTWVSQTIQLSFRTEVPRRVWRPLSPQSLILEDLSNSVFVS